MRVVSGLHVEPVIIRSMENFLEKSENALVGVEKLETFSSDLSDVVGIILALAENVCGGDGSKR